MAITFNERAVPAQASEPGIARQKLLTNERATGTGILLDRIALAAGATVPFKVAAKSIAWLQLLEGEATLKSFYTDPMSDAYSAFLPPGFDVTLSTVAGASVLYAELPDAGRFDPAFSTDPPLFMMFDWTRELVFKCENDERKRVFIVGPKTCGTKAMLVEMVIYPPGATGSDCHHEGADTLIYVLSGRGTAHSNEGPFSVRPGDVLYFPDRERHSLKAADSNEMRFLEFFVPGEFKTIWADQSKICRWVSTDCNIRGGRATVDDKEHQAFGHMFGFPIIR